MAQDITSEIRGQGLIITFNRPDQGNAMTMDMATQFLHILKPVTTDRGVRAILLRGQGNHFMNGLEMRMFAGDLDRALGVANQLMMPYHAVIRELQSMEKPVIAMVNGNVFGPGMSIMLASDLVLAGRNARFNCHFTSYALSPDGASSLHLARKVGAAKANELLMLSEEFGAEEAEKWHLVNRVIDDAKLYDEAMALLDRLANGPTRAYGAVKKLVGRAFDQDLNTQLSLEHTYWGSNLRSFDFRESIKAFFAKREAKYTGA